MKRPEAEATPAEGSEWIVCIEELRPGQRCGARWAAKSRPPRRLFASQNERDRCTGHSYRLSADMEALLGRSAFVSTVADLEVIAAWFWDARSSGMARGRLREAVVAWVRDHYGRELEPVAQDLLWWAIRRRLVPGEGIAARRDPLRDAGEERWLAAGRRIGAQGSRTALEYVRAIAKEAGASVGDGPQSMPEALVEDEGLR